MYPIGVGPMVPNTDEKVNHGPVMDMDLELNHIYLFKERRTHIGYRKLAQLAGKGMECLCITRDHPRKIKEAFTLANIRFLWLTGNKTSEYDTLAPNEISRLSTLLSKYISEGTGQGRALLFDHLEYLVTQNSFQTMLRVIHMARDKVMMHPFIFLLAIDPMSLDPKEVRLLERESEVIDLKDY